jgi:hypothetical protein
VQQRLDILYPALAAMVMGLSLGALSPRRFGPWRWAAALAALPIAICDYLENHAVAAMIAAGPDGLTAALVDAASRWTVLKSASTTAVMVVLVVLLGAAGLRCAHSMLGRLRVS